MPALGAQSEENRHNPRLRDSLEIVTQQQFLTQHCLSLHWSKPVQAGSTRELPQHLLPNKHEPHIRTLLDLLEFRAQQEKKTNKYKCDMCPRKRSMMEGAR